MKKKKITKHNWTDFATDIVAYLFSVLLVCVNFVTVAFFGIMCYETQLNNAATIFFIASCCNTTLVTALCFKGIKKIGEWK